MALAPSATKIVEMGGREPKKKRRYAPTLLQANMSAV